MAIAAVKATKASSASGTTVTMTALTATGGNALFVVGSGFNGTAMSVTRTGETYTVDINGASGGSINWTGIASAPNVAAAANDLVVTMTNGNGITGFAFEASGLPTSAILDATSPAKLTGTSTAVSTNSLSNATANAIFIAGFGDEGATNDAITPGAGWTNVVGGTTMAAPDGTTTERGGLEYQIVSSVAGKTGDWTITSHPWIGVIAVYKASGTAATILTRQPRTVIQQAMNRAASFFRRRELMPSLV